MLEALYDMGWVLQAAVDTSKKSLDEGWSQPPNCKPCYFIRASQIEELTGYT